jgi:putative transposase
LTGAWTPHDTRDAVVDFVNRWAERAEIPCKRLVGWIGISTSKFHSWKGRYGQVNEHNAMIPRDHWLDDWEKQAIVDFHGQFPLEGYRRLAIMMLDRDIVAASPASVYRVLKKAGLLGRRSFKPARKGSGFQQPLRPHEHWHVDVSHINVAGTFYYLCSLLDGCSRYIVHWEIRESMKEAEVETIIQRAREKFPEATPRIISDNGPQFLAKDFKEFIRICGMTHVKTSPYYPQSNGKIERWHRTLKSDCIRVRTPLSLEDAQRIVAGFVLHYNHVRLHSAIGYVTPKDKLEGREQAIFAERHRKLEQARERRKAKRQSMRPTALALPSGALTTTMT